MKRLLRILIAAAANLSLLLCATSIAFWIRSYRLTEMWSSSYNDIAQNSRHHGGWEFASGAGSVAFQKNSTHMHGLADIPPEDLKIFRLLQTIPQYRQRRQYQSWPKSKMRATFGLPTMLGFGVRFSHGEFSRPPALPTSGIPPSRGNGWTFGITLPHWSLTTAFAIPFVAWLWFFRRSRHRRRAQQLAHPCCRICGYDLRASPLRCPECGNSNSASPAASAFQSR